MLLFSILVAGSFSLGASVANLVDPAALTALRFAIAALLIAALTLATGGVAPVARTALWRYLVLGGLLSLYFVLMFKGLKTANPVNASAVFTLTPILAAIFGWLLLRQITARGTGAALALGAVGALWVIFDGDPARFLRFDIGTGEAIYFLGCVAHAAYPPMVRTLNRGERPVTFTLGVLLAGTLMLSLWSAPALIATDWTSLPPLFWATLAYLSVCASAVTFLLLQYAAMRLPSAKVMAYTYLTPSIVIAWELARGASAPPAITLIGIALTITALLLLLRRDPA